MVQAVLDHVGADVQLTIAVANGTHEPGCVDTLGLDAALLGRARVVNHDARDESCFVDLGRTRRGTRLRVNRCLVESDAIVLCGRIKPHYFAGYGAGAKALFPGLGANDDIRVNHRLKSDPMSRAGVVEGNPCRDDLEEIIDALPVQPFLLNVVTDAAGGTQTAVAGDVRAAFRAGAEACAPLFSVDAPDSDVVIVSDKLPLTASLYQASKLAATGAPLVRDGGSLVIVAECPEGIGPLETVNRGIYEIGVKPRLPVHHRLFLVSAIPREAVSESYCTWAGTVEEAVGPAPSAVVLLRAGVMVVK
jgi:nickel-dependent lactate racemase